MTLWSDSEDNLLREIKEIPNIKWNRVKEIFNETRELQAEQGIIASDPTVRTAEGIRCRWVDIVGARATQSENGRRRRVRANGSEASSASQSRPPLDDDAMASFLSELVTTPDPVPDDQSLTAQTLGYGGDHSIGTSAWPTDQFLDPMAMGDMDGQQLDLSVASDPVVSVEGAHHGTSTGDSAQMDSTNLILMMNLTDLSSPPVQHQLQSDGRGDPLADPPCDWNLADLTADGCLDGVGVGDSFQQHPQLQNVPWPIEMEMTQVGNMVLDSLCTDVWGLPLDEGNQNASVDENYGLLDDLTI